MPAAKFLVSGRVQGVFYRASTREQASSLGLSGYAKNLLSGDVEVLVVGDVAAMDALEQWLNRGPPAARVESVSRENVPEDDVVERHGQGFHIC
ncbi:acylphosphatase [Rhodanobacter sp. MP1X3]|uniref:acylphosphatase n=1 Tax=Rhodanobacter sp. MP1X3 TaxID=2723086 RepID=UPI001614FF6D|nr:acylphosphatase [Rhodanobacter sp. MP1X3]MBB6241747.1 acylphosphatase [Rhodanobacter sp. MP1X3]